MESPEVESDILRRVRALLRELDGHHPSCQSDRGMLRWTLHKKIDQNPSTSCVLVRILVKELERAERGDLRHYIIPLLHTLMYTLIQAPCIPDELCARVYDFCKRLLTLPKPFCTIGLAYASRLKVERTAPGTLYQRMVISEQSLRSAPYPYQERIFIFADPELLPEAICTALVTDTEAARVSQSPRGCMSCVVTHALQAALGDTCDIHGLRARLQALPPGDVEHWFQQVVAAVECAGSEGGSERVQHTARLERIYHGLLGSLPAGNAPQEGLQGTPLPNPNISFHLWTEDEQLWKELVLFLRPLSQSCEPDCLGQDLDPIEIQDILPDCACCGQSRFSVLSTDSGIERDLPAQEEPCAPCAADTEHSRLHRKGGIKKKLSPLDSVAFLQAGSGGPGGKSPGKLPRRSGMPPEPAAPLQRLHTARVVLLGDDRILGRLAQAYHSLRKRETRRVFLTPRLNLQFYHIPVVPGQPHPSAAADHAGPEELCEVAGYLGRADPWYESNINTLCHMIPKLATMPSSPSRALVTDLFLTDVIAYYARMGTQPVCFQVHAVKVLFRDPAQEPAEDVFLTELLTQVQDSPSHRELSTTKRKTTLDGPGIDLTVTYRKVVLSDREKELALALRSTGLLMKAIPADEAAARGCLSVTITEIVRINNLAGRSFSALPPLPIQAVANRFKTRNIKIRSPEQRPFTVRLDKDSRRTYRDVIGLEVSPCLEPSYCLQKTRTMKCSPHETEDVGLVKYLPKSLLLPINTFAGVIQ
ncbi:phosphoinositide 3-kinase regulatory subunit 6 isoform X1 [Corvus moneduloides]|uniref:phosphoinositide 3-kinase regulatory subunit 6 isoform X1 n=1 Tax=Corvus moneduloides TaxID=1196302 RepID=UPI0013633DC8|nr:phosphoinositide 3-kinase regulatory subunit 6 isoform X1 [Corvus moneduloides]XP_031985187.1 phosphoinositide 3-kinase regulatory subunit 6 isoform X1 [Corvus moneduloides]XP_031985189.1 phosphoinositide 3-kinase regulatory subunit 6 isoform X1 [Corvus moneduloides]XP_031985190.1 phosphoinositide 3-kinase regulatory subunit 6 isoform X1 [Corvus moneduloides]